MFNLTLMAKIVLLISIFLILLSTILSKKSFNDREKSSPFECGFDPMNSSRMPFSIRFFLIAIIFLIFDVEITLILPMILILKLSSLTSWIFTSFSFIIILLIGLFHEWNQGALNWTF